MSRMLPEHLAFGNQVQRLWVRERQCGQVWIRTLERIMTGKQWVRSLILYLAKVYLIKQAARYSAAFTKDKRWFCIPAEFQLCDFVANRQIKPIQFMTMLRLPNDLHSDSKKSKILIVRVTYSVLALTHASSCWLCSP